MRPDIDILLEKYWEIETSVEEEKLLITYFSSNEVDVSHLDYKPLFETFHCLTDISYEANSTVDSLLEKYWDAESTEYEEIKLRDHFSSLNIDNNTEDFQGLFNYWSKIASLKYSKDISVDKIIDKYWEGESSLDEEQFLKEYFSSEYILPQHESFKEYFQFWELSQTIEMKSDIKIDSIKEESKSFKVVSLRKWAYAAAAVFVLGLSSLFVMRQATPEVHPQSLVYEIEDPEEAYRVTMEALAMLSYKYKKSEDAFMDNISHLNAVNVLSN